MTTATHHPTHGPSDEDARLLWDAQRAATRRAHDTNPDVVALVTGQVMAVVERAAWTGIALGLLFTMTSVQEFGANGAATWSLPWLAAWLLAPLVEIPLLAILRGEQLAGRFGVEPGPRVRRARWLLITCTYTLNTWTAWTALADGGPFRDVVEHSVPVLAVLAVSSAMIDLRQMTVDIVEAAVRATVDKRRPAARPAARKPSPTPRASTSTPDESDDVDSDASTQEEAAPPPPPPPNNGSGAPADGRGVRQTGVEWALAHWRDDLRPVEVGEGMLADLGINPSKGERSRILADARALVEEARATDPTAYTRQEVSA